MPLRDFHKSCEKPDARKTPKAVQVDARAKIVQLRRSGRTTLSPEYQTWRAAALALADARRMVTYDRQSDPVPVEAPDHSPTHAPAPARV